jgi:hypothetical protein
MKNARSASGRFSFFYITACHAAYEHGNFAEKA